MVDNSLEALAELDLRTSPSQLYRLLDPTNSRKSVDRMLGLLRILGCEVDIVVRPRAA